MTKARMTSSNSNEGDDMSRHKEECPKCGCNKRLTRHHIFPKRHFKSNEVILLCRECHDKLESIINDAEYLFGNGRRKKMKRMTYYEILVRFIRGKEKA